MARQFCRLRIHHPCHGAQHRSGGESDEDKIASAIEESATSTDPAICKETQTQAFMEQTSGGASGYRWGVQRKKMILARERDR